jgi:GGDEF domain-containing protein
VEIQVNRDPKSGLPKGQIIEDELRSLMHTETDWTYIDMKLNGFEAFYEVYGFVARDEVKKFMTRLISEVLNEYGTKDDFVGHPADDNFIIITHVEDVDKLKQRLAERFNADVKQHYSFIDRERGYILVPDPTNGERQESLMTLSTGSVSTRTHQFSDIREIVELAAEDRRRGISGETDSGSRILTSW